MIDTLVNAFRTPEIRRKLFFVAAMLVAFRLLSHVPVPGADPAALSNFFKDNALFGLLDLFSGGGLARFSVVGLGLNPYINASIIMQLMSGVVPRLIELSREGEYGRNKINQYTRYLTLLLAVFQSYGISMGLQASSGVVLNQGVFFIASTVITLTGGTMFLMWLGEQITERGIGNGISMIILAGIIAGLPGALGHAKTGAGRAPRPDPGSRHRPVGAAGPVAQAPKRQLPFPLATGGGLSPDRRVGRTAAHRASKPIAQ